MYACMYTCASLKVESYKQEIERMKQFVLEAGTTQEEALASAAGISAQFEDINNQKMLWMVHTYYVHT